MNYIHLCGYLYSYNNYVEAINLIKKKGFKAGISIKPNTSITSIAHLLKDVDLVLIMSVEPGFGGQEYIKDSSGKINYLKQLREINGYNYVIEVDGGINETTIKEVKNADIVVVGSYLFKQSDIPKCIYDLKNTN
jgi:ribulose-phosphate 3-epimerase